MKDRQDNNNNINLSHQPNKAATTLEYKVLAEGRSRPCRVLDMNVKHPLLIPLELPEILDLD